ncbi:MAG: tRNA lysidine(34) synthetase TilS [Burkholderiaceae bacterium]
MALSAGADSTALLLAASRLWPGGVVALHVNHGMQVASEAFEEGAQRLGSSLGVPFRVERLVVSVAPGQSPEDAARRERYRALGRMAHATGAMAVLLGHQADDQAETLMLALGRGAGLPGLAAMAPIFQRDGTCFGRPFLSMRGDRLRAWLLAQGVSFVEDPSNQDLRFTRNRIRHVLMPAWEQSFPGFRETVARSARHAAEAQRLLTALAEQDLREVGEPPAIAALQRLSRERQANVLRHWLRLRAGHGPSTAQLDALLGVLAACRTRGHQIHLRVAGGWVRRDGGGLIWTPSV